MKSNFQFLPVLTTLCHLVLPFLLGSFAQTIHAATLWTGPNISFTQSATNLADELVPGAVSLDRAYSQWLFNPDAGDYGPGLGTPTDTEWAFGALDNYAALGYQTFDLLRNGDLSDLLVGNPMVVHLIHEDIYLSLTFSAWPQHGGYFAYTRSTPATVIISSPQITNHLFAFDYTVTPGLGYVVRGSSNLLTWQSLVTNVPTSNSVHFTDIFIPNGARYYRVDRLPIP